MRMFKLFSVSNTSQTVALASALSFGTQVVFALLMLRWFTPQEVGEFSVISQIAFFWMTLALAQAPLSLLANANTPPVQAVRLHWQHSLQRGIWLMPLSIIAVWFTHLPFGNTLVWVALIALSQMSWQLAQSFTLRTASTPQQAWVRILPPLFALVMSAVLVMSGTVKDIPILALSAWVGYTLGATWLVPAWLNQFNSNADTHTLVASNQPTDFISTTEYAQTDNRSTSLRFAHTAVDAMLATAIMVVWQRLYGGEETGWMSALLRVFGFVPAVVHMAWAQVALATPTTQRSNARTLQPWWLGLMAWGIVMVLGVMCAGALAYGWLDTRWLGVQSYILPLVLWQGCACVSAAFSHRPFQTQSAHLYSWACIGLGVLQLGVLLTPMAIHLPIDATQHMVVFSLVSSAGLLSLGFWMSRLQQT